MFGEQTSGPEPKTERWTYYRYRRNWDTISLEVLWSRASKTVSHEEADLELDSLTNRKPLTGGSHERRDMGELWDAPMRLVTALRTD